MSSVYGYARCSTTEMKQDIDRQKRELRQLGVKDDAHIYWEYESGAKVNRPELEKLFAVIQPGDTIAVTEVSRITRSTSHLCAILNIIKEQRLKLVIGSFVVDCTQEEMDPMTKGMLMMWGVFSEMERDIISQRVKSGMRNAAAKGKHIGRPRSTVEDVPSAFWKVYVRYQKKQLNISEMAKILGCARGTVYKYIAIAEQAD